MTKKEQIKVVSSVYDVEYKKSIKDHRNYELLGQISYDSLWIRIWSKIPRKKQLRAIVHEGTHAMSNEMNLDLPEKTILPLSNAIYAFIIDNKWLIKEILELNEKEGKAK